MTTDLKPGQLVQLVPPFSGKHVAPFVGMVDHPKYPGTKVYAIKLGGHVYNLVDWQVRPVDSEQDIIKPEPIKIPTKKRKTEKTPAAYTGRVCACGCGGPARSNFIAGHDMKAKSKIRKYNAKEIDQLPDALVEFIKSTPKWAEKLTRSI